jgi:RimJ/RimL family protein N-acetyltransferase
MVQNECSAAVRRQSDRLPRTGNVVIGELTVLRPVALDDLPVMEAWDRDPAITALMGKRYEQTSVYEWYRSMHKERSSRALAIETLDGDLIGGLELADLNWRERAAELRICIGEKAYWNRGYGTDALQGALQLAFMAYRLNRIYLRVFITNERAVHVYERVGFRKEALLPPCARRQDPAPVLLMAMKSHQWAGTMGRGELTTAPGDHIMVVNNRISKSVDAEE